MRGLQAERLDARGPHSPDTVAVAARRGDHDAVVSMVHDQGQTAVKPMGFDCIDGLREAFALDVRMAAAG